MGQRHWEDPKCHVTLWYDRAHQCCLLLAPTGVLGRGPTAAPMGDGSGEVTEETPAAMQAGCKGFWGGGWVLADRMRPPWPMLYPQPGAASLPVKYMKEISPYFKNSSAGATVSWDPSPTALQKRSSPLLPPRELREGRTVPLKMCYVSRKCLPADPEHRSGHGVRGWRCHCGALGHRGPAGTQRGRVPAGTWRCARRTVALPFSCGRRTRPRRSRGSAPSRPTRARCCRG